jgi:adenosylcobinamide amidohydrolase
MHPERVEHHTSGSARPALLWRLGTAVRCASTATVGGGLGERRWILNVQVPLDYARVDLEAHVAEVASDVGCRGTGIGMLTAASFDSLTEHEDRDVHATATVGVSKPTWAADVDDALTVWRVGTINIVVFVPVALTDAAMLNALTTATEAKSQALFEHGVPGTGTASDAVCVVAPTTGAEEPFGGPRSVWGARVARAVRGAVAGGLA